MQKETGSGYVELWGERKNTEQYLQEMGGGGSPSLA